MTANDRKPVSGSLVSVGDLLRGWRGKRGMSQEALALAARTTCRYVSFVENGRAAPTRAMIERLAAPLEIHEPQYSMLFEAAGFLPNQPPHDPATLVSAREVIEPILMGHDPHPAFAVLSDWTLIAANGAAMDAFRGGPYPGKDACLPGMNVIDLLAHPEGLRQQIENWPEYMWRALQYLYKVWRRTGIEPDVLERIREYPGITELEEMLEPPPSEYPPGALVLRGEQAHECYFQLNSRMASPDSPIGCDVRIQLLFPAHNGVARRDSAPR
jgi:transcriptional regulator with XRE-family HTH domain